MPLSTTLVGRATAPQKHLVDARWLMAYAAGLGETAACYFDTLRDLVAHPLFPVCIEWDPILALRFGPGTETMSPLEQARAVHADHDLHLLEPLRAGGSYTTIATAIGVEQRAPGAYFLKRLDTRDAESRLVCRTYQGTLYRSVGIEGEAASIDTAPVWPTTDAGVPSAHALGVGAQAAHVYSECARIWNPIHTDRAHALAAGLPAIILHGTATLALAVSRLIETHLGGDPTRVARLGARFSGLVFMPSTLRLVVTGADPRTIAFEVLNPDGSAAIRRGFLGLRG